MENGSSAEFQNSASWHLLLVGCCTWYLGRIGCSMDIVRTAVIQRFRLAGPVWLISAAALLAKSVVLVELILS